MKESWHAKKNVRLSALRVKKSLGMLAEDEGNKIMDAVY